MVTLLDLYSSIFKFRQTPSQFAVSKLYKAFLDPTKLINEHKKGGRPKLDLDSNIQAYMAAHPDVTSTRKLAKELKVSQATIARRTRKF